MPELLKKLGDRLKAATSGVWFGTTERERWCVLIVAFLLVIGSLFKLMRLKGAL